MPVSCLDLAGTQRKVCQGWLGCVMASAAHGGADSPVPCTCPAS